MSTSTFLRLVTTLLLASAFAGPAQGGFPRYPFRLPEWVWDTPENAHLLSAEEALSLRHDMEKHAALEKLADSRDADAVERDIVRRIGSKFCIRDLVVNAVRVGKPSAGLDLAVRIDPEFTPAAQATIRSAIARFVEVALEPDVIDAALARSTPTPPPMPLKYKTEEGQEVEDKAGRKVFAEPYTTFLQYRSKPESAAQFAALLRRALSPVDGDPALIVISSYSGNPWWGGAYYGFFTDPVQQLTRESPGRGYLYIRLNTDKFLEPNSGWNDPDFWASKIAHEVLHSLGYWHPEYTDPDERDKNNTGKTWAFMVAYEAAILDRLKRK